MHARLGCDANGSRLMSEQRAMLDELAIGDPLERSVYLRLWDVMDSEASDARDEWREDMERERERKRKAR